MSTPVSPAKPISTGATPTAPAATEGAGALTKKTVKVSGNPAYLDMIIVRPPSFTPSVP